MIAREAGWLFHVDQGGGTRCGRCFGAVVLTEEGAHLGASMRLECGWWLFSLVGLACGLGVCWGSGVGLPSFSSPPSTLARGPAKKDLKKSRVQNKVKFSSNSQARISIPRASACPGRCHHPSRPFPGRSFI